MQDPDYICVHVCVRTRVCVCNLASGSLVVMWTGDMIPTATGATVVMPTVTTMTAVPPAWLDTPINNCQCSWFWKQGILVQHWRLIWFVWCLFRRQKMLCSLCMLHYPGESLWLCASEEAHGHYWFTTICELMLFNGYHRAEWYEEIPKCDFSDQYCDYNWNKMNLRSVFVVSIVSTKTSLYDMSSVYHKLILFLPENNQVAC